MFTVTGVTTSLLFLVANAVCKQTVVVLAILDFAFVEECMETFACQVASVSGQCLQPLQRSQLSFLWHLHAQWQVEQPDWQLQPWVIVGMDSSSGPPWCPIRPPVYYCFCSTIFWHVWYNEDSACSLYAFLLHPQRAFVSDGTQLVDLTFRDNMPLTLTRADQQYIFVHPNMGRFLLVRSASLCSGVVSHRRRKCRSLEWD